MTDTYQPTVDTAGIERTAEGQIADGQTTPEVTTETPPPTKPEGKTLLTEGEKPPAEPKPPAAGAPEKYEDYKVPDGYTLDPEIKTEADALFKGLGLSQEAAQSLVDFYTSKTTEAFQAPFKAYTDMTDGWRKDAEGHPDLRGKLGPGQEVNVRIAKALDGLGDPKLVSDFKELMDLTGAGNNQAFIRVINKLAEKATEGTHVAGGGPSRAGQSEPGRPAPSAAAAIWPKLPSSR